MKNIVIIAGDKSGDLYGGLLAKSLKQNYPQINLYSFGGSELKKHSHQFADLTHHAVSGLIEVFRILKDILKIFKNAIKQINKIKPDLIILIDFPDFNLRLAKKLNKKYSIFYYVSPQIWAWRKARINLIKEYIEKMIVLFPFEKDFYEKENVQVEYFGHPLLEIIPKDLNVERKKIISFLPGSRKNEIKRHLPVMNQAKKILEQKLPNYKFQLIRPENIAKDFYKQVNCEINLVDHNYATLAQSEFMITASGTATVEIAVLNVPFLILYKMNTLTYRILKLLVKTKYIGMVNILAGKKIIEELIQEQADAVTIAQETIKVIANPEKYQKVKTDLSQIKTSLMPENATENFTKFIGEYLGLN